jgi:formylglycine-generating enzyme required for sulfatase activity
LNTTTLSDVLATSGDERIQKLLVLADGILTDVDAGDAPADDIIEGTVQALLDVVESGTGAGKERLAVGELLGKLGDPRLRLPADDDYWATVKLTGSAVEVGRFLVTIAEWQGFVASGGYTDDSLWDEAGKAWRDGVRRLWPALAAREEVRPLLVPNQPVVGVSWHEATAYARKHDARLLTFDERMQVSRGTGKRPYPWGEPFGRNNANTREEVLGKPCAVGLYRGDRTPEGVCDLAGNVAEWTGDAIDDQVVIHPGSWEQPSMAAWAKARSLEPARTRGADLGFRLARD